MSGSTTYFGLNIATLVGFAAMGIGFNLARQSRARRLPGTILMAIGTALVLFGMYQSHLSS